MDSPSTDQPRETVPDRHLRFCQLASLDSELREAIALIVKVKLIRNFQDSYDTNACKGSALLTVAQKPRANLGRAVLANPDFFIKDEAGSSVDIFSEVKIQAALQTLLYPTPNFVSARHLSSFSNTD